MLEERLRLDGLAQEQAEVLLVGAHAGRDDLRGLHGVPVVPSTKET